METHNEYLITEEEFKTLDTDNISEILLKDGTTSKIFTRKKIKEKKLENNNSLIEDKSN